MRKHIVETYYSMLPSHAQDMLLGWVWDTINELDQLVDDYLFQYIRDTTNLTELDEVAHYRYNNLSVVEAFTLGGTK